MGNYALITALSVSMRLFLLIDSAILLLCLPLIETSVSTGNPIDPSASVIVLSQDSLIF